MASGLAKKAAMGWLTGDTDVAAADTAGTDAALDSTAAEEAPYEPKEIGADKSNFDAMKTYKDVTGAIGRGPGSNSGTFQNQYQGGMSSGTPLGQPSAQFSQLMDYLKKVR